MFFNPLETEFKNLCHVGPAIGWDDPFYKIRAEFRNDIFSSKSHYLEPTLFRSGSKEDWGSAFSDNGTGHQFLGTV